MTVPDLRGWYAGRRRGTYLYHTHVDNIMSFGILSPGAVYRGGVVYNVPQVIKWVVVWD